MELEKITSLLGNFGIPSIILFWLLYKIDKYLPRFFNHFHTISEELQKIRFILDNIQAKLGGKQDENR